MRRLSPLIISALLHLAIGAVIWLHSGANHPVPQRVLYVDLSAVSTVQPSEAAPLQQGAEPQLPAPEEENPSPAGEEQGGAQVAAAQTEPAGPIASPEVEPPPAPPAVAPDITRAFAGASRVQEMMYQTRRYYEMAGLAVRQVLEGKLPADGRRQLEGKRIRIVASYQGDAAPELTISGADEGLQDLIEDKSAWALVPSPRQCKLQYSKVAFLVSVERGAIQVGLSPQ